MKKIMLIVILGIFMISLVSAGVTKSFVKDEIKSTDMTKYGKITLKEKSWIDVFGWFEKTKELTLKDNTEICKNGKCNANVEVVLEDDGVLIEDIRFIGDQPESYQIYVNNKLYELGTEVKSGTYDVDIKGELEILSKTDWQIKVGGYWLEEWALWGAADGLTHYWRLDETSGTIAEDIGGATNGVQLNLTLMGETEFNTNGLINGKVNGTGSAGAYMTTSGTDFTGFPNSTNPFAVSMWVKVRESGTGVFFNIKEPTDNNGIRFINIAGGNMRVFVAGSDTTNFQTGIPQDGSQWTHLVLQRNESLDLEVFVNNTLVNVTKATGSIVTGNITLLGGGGDELFGDIDEVGMWDRSLTVAEIDDLYNGGVGLSFESSGTIITELNYPENYLNTINRTLFFNCTSQITSGLEFTNATLYIWNPDSSLRITNFTELSGTYNSTVSSIYNLTINDSYEWNYYLCGGNETYNFCEFATSNYTFNITAYEYNEEIFNVTSYETATENFLLNISVNELTSISSATLNLNGSSYSGTNIGSSTNQLWKVSLTNANSIIGNKTFNWTIDYGSGTKQTNLLGQDVNNLIFDLCNATNNVSYVNYTFKDEGTLTYINGSITTSTFEYYLGDGSVTKTLTFINTSDNPSYAFCLNARDKTLNVDPYIQYKQGTTYPQRIYNPTLTSYTNTTTNKILYLLSSTDGIYTTFQVLDSSNRPLNGVDATVVRTIDEESVTVGTGTTDSAGSVTFWVNPDFSHTFTFTKSGYGSVIYSIIPTQSSYTINLGTNSSQYLSESDLDGLKWYIFPSIGIIENSSERNFGFNITSSNSNLQMCRIDILNQNKSITLSTNQENAISSNSSCFVQTNYSSSLDYQIIKGRLLIDIGDGWVQLEDDANWIFETTNTTGSTLTDFFVGLKTMDLELFNDNPNHRDYTYILIFFLVTTIICAVMNYAGWDIQERGGMVFLMWIFVVIASIPGFLTFNDISNWDWFNQYYFAFVYSCFVIGYFTRRMI